MFKAIQNSLLSVVYPGECRVCSIAVCDINDGVACGECWTKTRTFRGSESLCGKCGIFFGDDAPPSPVFCHRCDGHFYQKASAIGIYEHALAASIISLKTSPHIPRRIVDAIRKFNFPEADILVPIPLSKQRKLERGFNQAEVIAAAVSRATKIPVDALSLVRKTHTPIHRTGMDEKARDLSVRNAFEVVRPKLIAGKSVLLVDDVLTSGSTVSHCAEILKKHGALRVDVFTLARAVMR